MTSTDRPRCLFCDLPIKPEDEHGTPGDVDPHSGDIPVTCRVTLLCRNPRRLGVITDIQGDTDGLRTRDPHEDDRQL